MHNLLKADHDDLRRQMTQFAQAMETGGRGHDEPPADMSLFLQCRSSFSAAFRAHLVREDKEIQEVVRLRGDAKFDAVRQEHDNRFRDLFLSYSAHIKCWTPLAIKADWLTYRRAVMGLQRRYRLQMDWEERTLHPLMASDGKETAALPECAGQALAAQVARSVSGNFESPDRLTPPGALAR